MPDAWRVSDYSLTFRSWPLLTEANPENDLRGLRGISLVGKDLHRDGAQGLVGKSAKQHEGVAHWAGVQSHFRFDRSTDQPHDGRANTVLTDDERPLVFGKDGHLEFTERSQHEDVVRARATPEDER